MGLEPKSMDVIPSNIVIVYTEFRMGFFVVVVVVTGFVFSGWHYFLFPLSSAVRLSRTITVYRF